MSGPKISYYELNAWGKRIFDEQLHCEEQAVLCAQETQKLLDKVLESKDEIQNHSSLMDILEDRGENMTRQRDALEKVLTRLDTETDKYKKQLQSQMPTLSPKYRISEEALESKRKALIKIQKFREKVQALYDEIMNTVENGRGMTTQIQQQIMNDIMDDDLFGYEMLENKEKSERTIDSIIEDIGNVSFELELESGQPDTSFFDVRRALEDELTAMKKDSELSNQIISDINVAIEALGRITEIQYLRSFETVTIQNIRKRVEQYKISLEKSKEEFNNAYQRYSMLCSSLGVNPQEYTYSDDMLEKLESEIKQLESELLRQQEQMYVSECVDDVLTEMGYDVIGSREVVKKKSGKRFQNQLYSFNDGTAVNVTYASDGQISMELGGIAREDRLPNQEEIQRLTHDMESFCEEFAEFERRMEEKGIAIKKRVAFSPPTADYASIINVSDYDMADNAQITEIVSSNRKRKTSEKKVIRRDE